MSEHYVNQSRFAKIRELIFRKYGVKRCEPGVSISEYPFFRAVNRKRENK